MIRESNKEDQKTITNIIKKEIVYICDSEMDYLFCDNSQMLIYEEQEQIVGFVNFGRWGKNKENGKFIIYIPLKYRNKGYGTILYNHVMNYFKPFNLKIIESIFYGEDEKDKSYYIKKGFNLWYQQYFLTYKGTFHEEENLEITTYDNSMFYDYVNTLREAFYDMRRDNDFKPYYCLEFSDEVRIQLLKDKDNIFIIKKGSKIVAAASYHIDKSDSFGPVFVDKDYQKKGYGKKIVKYMINKALKDGKTNFCLDVLKNNIRAKNMYLELGFIISQTMNSYRIVN